MSTTALLENNNSASDRSFDNRQDPVSEHPVLALANYHALEKIGVGAQGTMYRALNADNQQVAIKIFNIQNAESFKNIELVEREINLLKTLQINGVPRFIEYIHSDTKMYLVEEFVDAPSLAVQIKQNHRYTLDQITEILKNMAKILRDCGNVVPPVIHRDIKPANILIDENMNAHLVDFGVAASVINKTIGSTYAGTPGYIAPEQVYGKSSLSSDIFSLGVTMIHLITGVDPCEMNVKNMMLDFESYLPSNVPAWLRELLRHMIAPNVDERIQNGEELLNEIEAGEAHRASDGDGSGTLETLGAFGMMAKVQAWNPQNAQRRVYTARYWCFFVYFAYTIPILLSINSSNTIVFVTIELWLIALFNVVEVFCREKLIKDRNKQTMRLNDLAHRAIVEQRTTKTNDAFFDGFVNQTRGVLRSDPEHASQMMAPLSEEENFKLDKHLKANNIVHPCVVPTSAESSKTHSLNGLITSILLVLLGGSYIWWNIVTSLKIYHNIGLFVVIVTLVFQFVQTNIAFGSNASDDIHELYLRRFMRQAKIDLDSKD